MKKLKLSDLKTNKKYLFYHKYRKEWLLGIYSKRNKYMLVNQEYVVDVDESTLIYSLPKLV